MVIVVAIIALVLLLLLRGLIVMWLWNWLMPSILGLPEINMLEGLGLMFLAMFLFGTMFDRNTLKATNKQDTKKD